VPSSSSQAQLGRLDEYKFRSYEKEDKYRVERSKNKTNHILTTDPSSSKLSNISVQ